MASGNEGLLLRFRHRCKALHGCFILGQGHAKAKREHVAFHFLHLVISLPPDDEIMQKTPRSLGGAVFWRREAVLFFIPQEFLAALVEVPADRFAAATNVPACDAENAPHAGLHIPAQRAGTVQIIPGAAGGLRLDIENIAHADRALERDDPGEGILAGPSSGGRGE